MIQSVQIKYDEKGLVPVITQDARTGAVLMHANMTEESLALTLQKGHMVYWSRSRQCLWEKGATSGQIQKLVSLAADCDGDCLLARVEQLGGGACHTGEYSCFYNPVHEGEQPAAGAHILYDVAKTVADRHANPKEGSYTNYLFDSGLDKILKKVGEEATETVIAAKNCDPDEISYEMADLFYHLIVLLQQQDMTLDMVFARLQERR